MHSEAQRATHLSTEAVCSIGGAVCCPACFHWALDSPCCIQAATVIQGQAVLRWWWGRWRESRKWWWHESLLTASIILRALFEYKNESEAQDGGAFTLTGDLVVSKGSAFKSHKGIILNDQFLHESVRINACISPAPPHTLNIHSCNIYY